MAIEPVPLRPLRFLVPGTTGRFRCGGLQVELQTARLTAALVPTEVVTYRQREPDHPFLSDLLRHDPAPGSALWIVSWGFDVPQLLGSCGAGRWPTTPTAAATASICPPGCRCWP